MTSAVTGRRSNQLSHWAILRKRYSRTLKTSYRFQVYSPPRKPTLTPSACGQALDLLVTVSFTCCHASTPDLSTLSSSRGLSLAMGCLILRGASRLDAFSAYPVRAWLPCCGIGCQQVHQRRVHPGPLVLGAAPLKHPPPAPDRDRTVSRRSEPSSRTTLMGEQPNPWDCCCPWM